MKRGWSKYNSSNKSLSELGKLAHTLYTDTSDITSNVFFRTESALERLDRYANFIHQAKLESQATGKTVEDILKQSSTDKKLFNKLNTEVNKDQWISTGTNKDVGFKFTDFDYNTNYTIVLYKGVHDKDWIKFMYEKFGEEYKEAFLNFREEEKRQILEDTAKRFDEDTMEYGDL